MVILISLVTTKQRIEKQCQKIRELLEDPKMKRHSDIYRELKIPSATYFKRFRKIQEEDTNKKTQQEIPNKPKVHTRRIIAAIDAVIDTNYEIMTDKYK
jgi:hypothetical protein